MFASKLGSLLLPAVLVLGAASAHATVIDFEGITSPNVSAGFASGHTIPLNAGYTVTVTGTRQSGAAYVFGGPPLSDTMFASNGTAYLTIVGDTGITMTSSSLFNVNSIDLGNIRYFASGGITATLTGTYADGSANIVTSYLFNNDNALTTNDFTTEMLTGFTNLTSFAVTTSGIGYSLAIDNISVSAVSVPEPSTGAVLGLGLLLMGAASRRKKSA